MNTSLIVIIVLSALALFAVLFIVGTYNKLVGLRNGFKNAYAQIDVQLKRRYDLIPDLVVFPSNIIAGMFQFNAAELFAIDEPEQREPTKVSFA